MARSLRLTDRHDRTPNVRVQKLGALAEVSDEDFASLVQINLEGPFNTLREAVNRT